MQQINRFLSLAILSQNRLFTYFAIFIVNIFTTSTWFVNGYTITNNDLAYPIYPRDEFLERLSLFSQQRGLGTFLGNNLAGSPQRLVELTLFNFFPNYAQQIEFTLINILIGLSTAYLLNSFFNVYESKYTSLVCLLICFSQTWSLYLAFVWVRLQTIIYALIFLQFALALLIRFFGGSLRTKKIIFRLSLLSISLGWSLGTQPPILAIVFTVYMLLAIFLGIFQAKANLISLRQTFRFSSISLVIYGGLNLWWIYPLLKYSVQNNFFNTSRLQENFDVKNLVFFTSIPTSLFNSFRQLGDFAWFEGYWPELYPWLSSTPHVIVSFILPLLLLFGVTKLVFEQKSFHTFAISLSSLFMLFAIFATLGNLGPTGKIFNWALDNIPLFSLQRAPWQKFTFLIWLFSPALLFYSFTKLRLLKLKLMSGSTISNLAIVAVLVSFVFGPASLIYRGQMFSKAWNNLDGYHERNNFGFHIKFPSYVLDASDYLSQNSDNSDILLLPDSTTNNYVWGWGSPWDVTWQTTRAGIASRDYGEGLLPPNANNSQRLISDIYDDFSNYDYDGAAQKMQSLGINKVLVRNDFNRNFVRGSALTPKLDQDVVDAWNQLLLKARIWTNIRNFGAWRIYELNTEMFPEAKVFFLKDEEYSHSQALNQPSNLLEQRHSRNIQGSYRKIQVSSHIKAGRIILKENTADFWKVYSITKKRKGIDSSSAYLPWYSNLVFTSSIALKHLPLIPDILQNTIGIAQVLELPRISTAEWKYENNRGLGDEIIASFYLDIDMVRGLLATMSFLLFLILLWLTSQIRQRLAKNYPPNGDTI